MEDATPEWKPHHTEIAKKLEADVKANRSSGITYTSYSEYLRVLHGKVT